nr:MAG TPA: hypothetical protein [Caudoviricetes sp.]
MDWDHAGPRRALRAGNVQTAALVTKIRTNLLRQKVSVLVSVRSSLGKK